MTQIKQIAVSSTSDSAVRQKAQDLVAVIKAAVESVDVAFVSAEVRMSAGKVEVKAVGTIKGGAHMFMYHDVWSF